MGRTSLRRVVLAATLGLAMAAGRPGSGATAAAPERPPPQGMVAIPAGRFTPLFTEGARPAGAKAPSVQVDAFFLDAVPVTNSQFLAFVQAQPRWQRSQVKRIFAESGYLADWADELALGPAAPPDSPVTRVSWFAARAYCAAQGKGLPTMVQWEHAAAASATRPDGDADPEFAQQVIAWYSRPNPERFGPVGHGFRNVWGVFDLYGLVWEWTLDFNTALVTGESRADTALERGLYCGSGAVGASNFRDYAAFLRYGFRSSLNANYVVGNLGFRCAAPMP
jgi:formylglycine-generating enzyme required for sulfatase activity